MRLNFTAGFPEEQPLAKFITEIWHPNVRRNDGHVCVDLGTNWVDVCSVACVLVGLQVLLANPNPHHAMNHDCARQMREQPQQYVAQAQRWTQLHAM